MLDALQRAPRDDAVTRHNLIAGIKSLMNNSVSKINKLIRFAVVSKKKVTILVCKLKRREDQCTTVRSLLRLPRTLA